MHGTWQKLSLLIFVFSCLMGHVTAFAEDQQEIRLLTWNVADMYYPGDTSEMGLSRESRVDEIVNLLKTRAKEWQVVVLQEVWTKQGLAKLQSLKDVYPFILDADTHKIDVEEVFKNAWKFLSIKWAVDNEQKIDPVLNRGLTILSQLPILDSKTLTFSVNGDPKYARFDGEMLAGKGAVAVLLQDDVLNKKFWVVNTHLVANYENNPRHPQGYGEQREQQILELGAWIQSFNTQDLPVVLAGDLNVGPDHDTTPSLWQKIPELLQQFLIPQQDTTQATHNAGEVDHVFGTEDLLVETTDTIPARQLKISDHDALVGLILFL